MTGFGPSVPPRDAVVQALAWARGGRVQEALALLEGEAEEGEADARLLGTLSMLQCEAKRFEQSVVTAQRALAAGAMAAEVYLVLGRSLKALGRREEALGAYEAGCEAQPGSAELRLGLAGLLRDGGRWNEAVEHCREAVRLKPGLVEAHHNLGLALRQGGQLAPAAESFERAAALRPTLVDAWVALGDTNLALRRYGPALEALRRAQALRPELLAITRQQAWAAQDRGEHQQAIDGFTRVLAFEPEDAEMLSGLGLALHAAGRLDEAVGAYEQAVARAGSLWLVWNNLGVLRSERNEPAAAERCFRSALRARPDYPDALLNLGELLRNTPGRVGDALELLNRAAALRPDDPEIVFALGAAHRELIQETAAKSWMERALGLDPGRITFRLDYGALLAEMGLHDEALAATHATAMLAPTSVDALTNHAVMLYFAGRARESLEWFDRALALDASHASARIGKALSLLMIGDLAAGWALFDSRFDAMPQLASERQRVAAPTWQGEPLEGRTLLVMHEQGLGDSLQFVRFVREAAAHGGRILVEALPPLARLLRSMPEVAGVIRNDAEYPPFDLKCSMLSLPGVLGVTLDNLPADVPYLAPDPTDDARWQARVAGETRLKVGLVWSGDPRRSDRAAFLTDRRRSIPIDQFGVLTRVPNVRFYSLQKGEGALAPVPKELDIIDWTAELRDFADTAALVRNLDLVVTVDTSVAHLAGALGRPVWLLSRSDGCWRWMLERTDSPWYPTMRIFRQRRPFEWRAVLEQVADSLIQLASSPRSQC